jgi:hypothetical protein
MSFTAKDAKEEDASLAATEFAEETRAKPKADGTVFLVSFALLAAVRRRGG